MARERTNDDKPARSAADVNRNRRIRQAVHQRTAALKRSARSEDSSAHGIDRGMDRIVSEQALHTSPGRGKQPEDHGARNEIERHRTEIRLATIAGERAKREEGHQKAARESQPDWRIKKHKKVERDFQKSGAGPAKKPKRKVTVDLGESRKTLGKAVAHATKTGAEIKVVRDRGRRRQPPRSFPGGISPDRRARLGFARPDMNQIRYGGNAGAVNAYRKSEPLTRSRMQQLRGQYEQSRTAAAPPR